LDIFYLFKRRTKKSIFARKIKIARQNPFSISAASAKINAADFDIQAAVFCTFKTRPAASLEDGVADVSQMHIAPAAIYTHDHCIGRQIEFDMHGKPFK